MISTGTMVSVAELATRREPTTLTVCTGPSVAPASVLWAMAAGVNAARAALPYRLMRMALRKVVRVGTQYLQVADEQNS